MAARSACRVRPQLAGPPRAEQAGVILRLACDVSMTSSRVGPGADFLNHMSHGRCTPMNAIFGLTEVTLGTALTPGGRVLSAKVEIRGARPDGFARRCAGPRQNQKRANCNWRPCPFDLGRGAPGRRCHADGPPVEDEGLSWDLSCAPEVPRQLRGDPKPAASGADRPDQQCPPVHRRRGYRARCGLGLGTTQAAGLALCGAGCRRRRDGSPARRFCSNPLCPASRRTARKFGGTGLGLSICRGLVTLMGGRICGEQRARPGQYLRVSSCRCSATCRCRAGAGAAACRTAPAWVSPAFEPCARHFGPRSVHRTTR